MVMQWIVNPPSLWHDWFDPSTLHQNKGLYMFEIVNDLLDITTLDKINKEIFNTKFPWYFHKNSVVNIDNSKELYYTPGVLRHSFAIDSQINSESCYLIEPILDAIALKFESKIRVIKADANLLIPSPVIIEKLDIPHIDVDLCLDDFYTAIFYIHDNEFPTVIYNETTDNCSKIEFSKLTIKEKIYPTSNKLAIWQAKYIHSAPSCSNKPRVVINLNFKMVKYSGVV